MKKLAIAILLISLTASAQQDPQYTQYMYNMNVVNPAYAGLKESLSVTTLFRQHGLVSKEPLQPLPFLDIPQ